MTKPPANKKNIKSFSVAPSPFNTIKLELAMVIIVGGILIVMLDSITQDLFLQISIVFISGSLGMVWIMWRTHKLLKHHSKASGPKRAHEDSQI